MDYPKEWDQLPAKERKKRIKKLRAHQELLVKQKQDMRNKILFILGVSILLGLIVYAVSLAVIKSTRSIEGIAEYNISDWKHVTKAVNYSQSPPVGGDHHPIWVSCNGDVYDQEIDNERAVHALEHGAVWITYRKEDVSKEDLEVLKDKVQNYTFMSPYNDQTSSIVLTAWGHQLELSDANDPRVDHFIDKFRQGPQTPEPGATCNANSFGM